MDETTETLSVRGVTFYVGSQVVMRNGRTLDLVPREKKILQMMMRIPRQAVSLAVIIDYAFDDMVPTYSDMPKAYMERLRRKLRCGDEDDVLHMVGEYGWVFA